MGIKKQNDSERRERSERSEAGTQKYGKKLTQK